MGQFINYVQIVGGLSLVAVVSFSIMVIVCWFGTNQALLYLGDRLHEYTKAYETVHGVTRKKERRDGT